MLSVGSGRFTLCAAPSLSGSAARASRGLKRVKLARRTRRMADIDIPDYERNYAPAKTAWLNSHVKAKDKRKLDRNELFTPQDIQRLISVTPPIRDKTIISVLWESGGRIAEVGNRHVRQVVKHQFGFNLDMRG